MAVYRYFFTDGMTHETVEVFDVADLKLFAGRKARHHLQRAYGDADEEVEYENFDASDCGGIPDFDRLSGWELSGWCEWNEVLFEADGFPRWGDGAESIERVRLEHEVYGDNIYTFAELPSDKDRDAAAEWMWNNGYMDGYCLINRHELNLDVLRLCANSHDLLFTADGTCGFHRADCDERS